MSRRDATPGPPSAAPRLHVHDVEPRLEPVAEESENDTLCALVTRPTTTSYQRLEAVIAIYGIIISLGSVVFVVFGTLDLKYPTREAFHDILGYQLSWVPNILYMWVFALVAYIGILGFTYYCFGPRQKKGKETKSGDGCPCCPKVHKGGEKSIIAFIVLGLTIQLGIGTAIAILTFSVWKDPGKTHKIAMDGLLSAIADYGGAEESYARATHNIDALQRKYNCCGSESARDWVKMKKYYNSVPTSCCKGDNVTLSCGDGLDPEEIHTRGCSDFIAPMVKNYMLGCMLLTASVTGLEVLIIVSFWIYLSRKWVGKKPAPAMTFEQIQAARERQARADEHARSRAEARARQALLLEKSKAASQPKENQEEKIDPDSSEV